MNRYICIHGHFYQPPRENPWLERVELQDSAHPYHDWNERISEECYGPNAYARLLDSNGKVSKIVSNYSKMSFNFGPTLLSWLEKYKADIYNNIIETNKESLKKFNGHPSALAQAYNHIIMPLASKNDKYTQVLWGIYDYKHRFGNIPEGMWLPETAVCLETLEVLAECGIKFTVLSQYQAKRYRKNSTDKWHDAAGGHIDPTNAYIQKLPSGREIAIFFYDGHIAKAVAFEGLLRDGKDFAKRLTGAFVDGRKHAQIVNIATDGETYGHHHRFSEMALAYAFNVIEQEKLAKIINYGYFLELHPPTSEVEIQEYTAWSCSHGVERWRANCGCNGGANQAWNQEWRGPLRAAFDWLRDAIAKPYEQLMQHLGLDPWTTRNNYVEIILNRNIDNINRFFHDNCTRELSHTEKSQALKLLEMQRNAMLMYTSCGWFFDELSGIETVQCISYAGRALQLAQIVLDIPDIEPNFLNLLSKAKSNVSQYGNGQSIYHMWVKPNIINFVKVGAHYVVATIFEPEKSKLSLDSYSVHNEEIIRLEAGKSTLVVGRATFICNLTLETTELCFGALHFGDHNINAGVSRLICQTAFDDFSNNIIEAFNSMDIPAVLRILDKQFSHSVYNLKSLFRDEQRSIMEHLLDTTSVDLNSIYEKIYSDYYPLMCFLADMSAPLPRALKSGASLVIESNLRKILLNQLSRTELEELEKLIEDAKRLGITLDVEQTEHLFRHQAEELLTRLEAKPHNLEILALTEEFIGLTKKLHFKVNMWRAQNTFFNLKTKIFPAFAKHTEPESQDSDPWFILFKNLSEYLDMSL